MKYFILLPIMIILSCNSGNNKKQPASNIPVGDSTQLLQAADGSAINLIDGYTVSDTANDFILFPLRIQNAKDEEESVMLYSKQRSEGRFYWNIIFHNYKTGENTLLEPEKKVLIGGYEFTGYGGPVYVKGNMVTYKQTPFIFYTVYTDDYNEDKKLGTKDPAYCFVSNADGTGFRQVSPPNISITQKEFPKNSPYLLLSGIKDSNRDKKFDADDELVYYRVNMADSSLKTEEIFDAPFKIKLKKLFDKNWKK